MQKYLSMLLLLMPVLAWAAPEPTVNPEEVGTCDGAAPAGAVVELPAPLNKWGKVTCKPNGYAIVKAEGWYWSNPNNNSDVEIPSQMNWQDPKPLGNKSYFTEIKLTRLNGEAAEKAITLFEQAFDKSEVPPNVYRLDATSVSGKKLAIDFFEYKKHHWGMWCTRECDPNTKFMILDLR